jgi:hypothetical protein
VLRIHDILVRIRIADSFLGLIDTDSDLYPDSAIFVFDLQGAGVLCTVPIRVCGFFIELSRPIYSICTQFVILLWRSFITSRAI